MAGAFSLFLGMLGLGAAGAVSAGQNAKIKKADYQYGEEHGLHGTSEVLQMRERVRKEWWSICGKTYNACERPASSYGDLSRTPWCYLKKRWFIDHLNKKGIPYLAMPDFLAGVKRRLPLRSLSADTNHHFL